LSACVFVDVGAPVQPGQNADGAANGCPGSVSEWWSFESSAISCDPWGSYSCTAR